MKTTRIFHLEVFIFLVEKFSVYLNRHVFIMLSRAMCCGYTEAPQQGISENP